MNGSEAALIRMLPEMLGDVTDRPNLIRRFQEVVWSTPAFANEDTCGRILRDLAYDLDYYEPDPRKRAEDPSFYGEDRLEREIRGALERLKEMET
jgi:hypothetical protein